MKKKIIIIVAAVCGVLLVLWAAMFITDWRRSANLKMPVFARAAETADDGGSGTYHGIGYKIEVRCHMDADYGRTVDETTMTVFGTVVAAAISDRADPLPSDWGIAIKAENITPTGLILRFTQAGDKPEGELQTGMPYTLEQKTADGWEPVKALQDDIFWTSQAYMILSGGVTDLQTDWESLYGSLPAGEYRISKEVQLLRAPGDYDTNTYYAEFTVDETKTETDDWGITLAVQDVTKTGLRLIITQSGDKPEGELQTGSPFVLERKNEDKWEKAKFAVKGDIAWTSIAYMISLGQENIFDIAWSNLYGELNPGEYRISKEVQLVRAPGDYETKPYYAEFVIAENTPSGAVTYRRVDEDASVRITGEEAGVIKALLAKDAWVDGTADCLNDCIITLDGKDYYYHSDCGTVNDNMANRSLTLTEDEKEQLQEILEKGISLYYSGEKCPVE